MDMNRSDRLALELLLSNEYINSEKGYNIFLEYLKKCDPDAGSPLSEVFNIVISYFQPEGLYIEGLKPREQKQLILYLVSKGNPPDPLVEEYMEKLSELEKNGKDTEKSIKETQKQFSSFTEDVRQIGEQEDYGVVFTCCIIEEPIKDDDEEDGKAPAKGKTKEKKTRKLLQWRINDTTTGCVETGKLPIKDLSQAEPEKGRILGEYMARRPKIIQSRQQEMLSEIRSKNSQLGSIMDNKYFTQQVMSNYKDFKIMMEGGIDSRRRSKVTKLRESLRESYYTMDNEKAAKN